ncbi:MAG: MBL fold metallo-hydrolase [Candidatus Pacebacteria bacterium]|nr:MBL fold metallo-hydrolase [Candidatus Paceibacterota bacterium]
MKIGFYGAVGEVTGSNFILEGAGVKIMVDCGFFQGVKVCDEKNKKPFPYDLGSINAVFVTHSHLDHIGRIPKLFKEGFKGKVYSTPPTREISQLMFDDTVRVLGREAREDNHEPLYRTEDVQQTMENWETVLYEETVVIGEFHIRFRNAGHILGSAMLEVTHKDKKLVFSGDLGNSPAPLLPDTAVLSDVDYLVMEAVYGDRLHEDREQRVALLEEIVKDTIARGGTLMVPAFSIDRTQDLIVELNNLVESKKIPEIPVFVDSPLAIKVTGVYDENQSYFNKETKDEIAGGDDIFKFPLLRFTSHSSESIAIKDVPNPKIIIAGSGMSNGGRIMHHEANYLGDPNSTLLLIGYQAVNTMGRALQDGATSVNIFDKEVPVRAKVVSIHGYSAHKDMNALMEFVSSMQSSLKSVFVVHAELGVGLFFAQRVKDYLGINARVPKEGEIIEIDF